MRTLDGKRPVFVDDMKAVFFFPYLHVGSSRSRRRQPSPPSWATPVPVPVAVGASGPDDAADTADETNLEIDEDFLRRIREV